MVPSFPEFVPISLAQRAPLHAYLRAHPPLASEYTFTNLFAWGGEGHYALCAYGDGFLIRKGLGAEMCFLQPLVRADHAEVVRVCLDYLREQGAPPAIQRVGEDFLAAAGLDDPTLAISEDPDDFDYVYEVTELVALAGPKYHDKKNFVNQFERTCPGAVYRTLSADAADACLQFQHAWCEDRACQEHEGLRRENCAVHRMLRHFAALELHGGVLEVEGQIVAMELGERLNADTIVIHVEKASSLYPGCYQAINQAFLAHEAGAFRYVNREQDLGLPGLRKAKRSYHPVRMVKKYSIRGI